MSSEMEVIRCESCGAPVGENASRCEYCGSVFKVNEPNTMFDTISFIPCVTGSWIPGWEIERIRR